jgi:hypothetical protein
MPQRKAPLAPGLLLSSRQPEGAREGLQPRVGDAEGVQPGTEACPRDFLICSLRTMELRSTCCDSQKSPSATVKMGLSRVSSSSYSPTRNVVACQLAR